MPTDVTSSIGTTGRDYSTIQAWEDACPSNLVTDDKRWIGECYNDSVFAPSATISINGVTSDSTRYIILRCATGQSFADNASVRTNALRFNTSNGVSVENTSIFAAFDVLVNYTVIQGLQVRRNAAYSSATIRFRATSVEVDSCIIKGGSTTAICVEFGNYTSLKLINSLVEQNNASPVGIICYGTSATCYGCTIVNTAGGSAAAITVNYSNGVTLKNCAVFNFTNTIGGAGTLNSASSYCASDDTFPAGTNHQESLTFADQFESTTNDFRAKSTGDLQAGTPDSTNTPDDITGLTRDATTPWIGCWEVAGGGGAATRGMAFGQRGTAFNGGRTFKGILT